MWQLDKPADELALAYKCDHSWSVNVGGEAENLVFICTHLIVYVKRRG